MSPAETLLALNLPRSSRDGPGDGALSQDWSWGESRARTARNVHKGPNSSLDDVAGLAKRRKWFSLAAVNLGNFVPPLDTGIMSLILPTISINLQAPIQIVFWVPLESLIITAAFMPVFGRFSDSHGRKRFFILGLALFSIGAFLSGNSLTIYELLFYRVIQALGGAFILSNGRALIVDAFEPKERGFALGTQSVPDGRSHAGALSITNILRVSH